MNRALGPGLLLLFTLIPVGALATLSEKEATPGFLISTDLNISYNSWGLYSLTEATYRHPYRIKKEMVWSATFMGARIALSPAATRPGLLVGWMPAPFFKIRLHYDLFIYHGVFGYLLTFDNPDVPHDEPDIAKRYHDGRAGIGQRLWTNPTLLAKFGPVILRNQVDLTAYFVHTKRPWFFNWEYETISKRRDFVLGERFDLLFSLLEKRPTQTLYTGPFYALAHQPSTGYRRQQVGLSLYTEPFRNAGRWGTPRFMLIAAFNLEERYRKHEVAIVAAIGTSWRPMK